MWPPVTWAVVERGGNYFGAAELEGPEEGDAFVDAGLDHFGEAGGVEAVAVAAVHAGADEGFEACFEGAVDFVEAGFHEAGVGAAVGGGADELGKFVLIAGDLVEFEEALAGGDDAVAFVALVDHGDAGDVGGAFGGLAEVFEEAGFGDDGGGGAEGFGAEAPVAILGGGEF